MMNSLKCFVAILGVMLLAALVAMADGAEKTEESRDVRWHLQYDQSLKAVQDETGKPRVLLIGDSNSIGYTLPVRELLQGQANLHRIPRNGGSTTRGLEYIDQWLGEENWDVISFNWGAHDLKITGDGTHLVPIGQYESNLRKLVGRLNKTGAVLIWVATAPVPEGELTPPRSNQDVIAYNAVAEQVMRENKIAVNDIYSIALPRLNELQIPGNVHFTRYGYRVLGEAVAARIVNALND